MTDPIRARREQVNRLASTARKAGWALFGLATSEWAEAVTSPEKVQFLITVASLALGSALLLPAIIIGFGVTAAEREDRG